jgi:hypothetical protein
VCKRVPGAPNFCNPQKTSQVLVDLKIHLSTRPSCSDNGGQMAKNELPKLLQRFLIVSGRRKSDVLSGRWTTSDKYVKIWALYPPDRRYDRIAGN